MDSKRKKGKRFRVSMSNTDVGYLVYSYCMIGFFTGNEMNVLMAIAREMNESENSVCELSYDELCEYSFQKKETLKRSLRSLFTLGIISSQKTKNGSIKCINQNALDVLMKVYQVGKKKSVCVLRQEMNNRKIKSLLDVDEELLQHVFDICNIKVQEKDSVWSYITQHNSGTTSIQRVFEKSSITTGDLMLQYHKRKEQLRCGKRYNEDDEVDN